MKVSKKLFFILIATFVSLNFSLWGQTNLNSGSTQNGKVLVAYFSRVDENYGVGNITEGNTAKIAKIIAQKTKADLFEIKTTRTYDKTYNKAIQEAKTEQTNKERPPLVQDLTQAQINNYDTIFIGYPIWWGDLPMVVYTFLEGKNLDGKTIIPFCTHEGSGLSGTERTLRSMFPKSTVKAGVAIRGRTAQNDKKASEKAINDWLKNIGF